MVAARRSFAGIELQSTASKSDGTGRERKMRGFRSGDSGHGRRAGRRPAMDGHGGSSGSSWGLAGGNRTKMAWARRSTMLCSSARGGRRVRSMAAVHGDELRMVRGVTVQHPAQFIGSQRWFARKKNLGRRTVLNEACRRMATTRRAQQLRWLASPS